MNYYQKLIKDKESREQYEADKIRLREAISTISNYHASYDGQFLTELEAFLTNFKPKQ